MGDHLLCSSCERRLSQRTLTGVCNCCNMDLIYYNKVYKSDEQDDQRFNLSIFDPSVLEEKKFCINCVTNCSFCGYSMCEAHKHTIELSWFEDKFEICWECNDFRNKSFHFDHVFSGKVQFDCDDFDESLIDEASAINNSNEPFHHMTVQEVAEMTDQEKLRYFKLKYLIYLHNNQND